MHGSVLGSGQHSRPPGHQTIKLPIKLAPWHTQKHSALGLTNIQGHLATSTTQCVLTCRFSSARQQVRCSSTNRIEREATIQPFLIKAHSSTPAQANVHDKLLAKRISSTNKKHGTCAAYAAVGLHMAWQLPGCCTDGAYQALSQSNSEASVTTHTRQSYKPPAHRESWAMVA